MVRPGVKAGIAVVVLTVIVLVVLFVLPFSHSISGEVSTACCTMGQYFGYQDENLPSGPVTINWESTSSNWVQFTIFPENVNDLGRTGCSQSGISGSCSFESDGGTYTLALTDGAVSQTIETVTWSGGYVGPLL